MAVDDLLPSLKDPAAMLAKQSTVRTGQQAQAAKPKPAASGVFGGIMEALDSTEDPFTRSIMQGAIEAKISGKLGYRFHFPDPAEEELQKQMTANSLRDEMKKGAIMAVEMAQAMALDLDPAVRTRFGLAEGVDVFETDPDRAVLLSKAMYDAQLIPSPISKGMLAWAKKPTDSAAVAQEAQQKSLSASASNLDNATKLAKAQSEAIAGEGLIGGMIEQQRASFEGAEGVDVVGDADEARGSEVFYDFADRTVRDVSKATGQEPAFIAQAMLAGEYGENIRDELEGLPTNDLGELVVGQGDRGVADEATFYLAATVMNLAAQAGISPTDALRTLKLPYTGIDMGSLEATAGAIAKAKGIKPEVLIQSLGPGFLEAAGRVQAESFSKRKAAGAK